MYRITRCASTRPVLYDVASRKHRLGGVSSRLPPDDGRTYLALACDPIRQGIRRAAMGVSRSSRWGRVGACALCVSCCPHPLAGIPASERNPAASAGSALPARPDPLSTDALLGQVFGSVEDFVLAHPDYDSDNISTQQVPGSAFVWLVDRTPQTNGTWRLFERLEGGGARYLLCHSAGYWNHDPFRTLADPVVLDETLQLRRRSGCSPLRTALGCGWSKTLHHTTESGTFSNNYRKEESSTSCATLRRCASKARRR